MGICDYNVFHIQKGHILPPNLDKVLGRPKGQTNSILLLKPHQGAKSLLWNGGQNDPILQQKITEI